MPLADELLDWYDKNARKLPWRDNKDAYKIWVSEVMLQQTRVEVVKDYYKRWMERFPTPEILAQTPEQEVLQYWQGLGYYSRARHLLSGVREVCAAYGGKVPEDEDKIQKLPGVGEYTAGAILSIAYNQKAPAVDGNVLRIFSRLFCLTEDIMKQATKRAVYRLVREHMSTERPGDFNQALMDLGAAVCIPRKPRCSLCPLTGFCEAYAQEIQDTLPVRSPKKEPLRIQLAAGIVARGDRYLVRQRPSAGLLSGMWEFPALETAGDEAPEKQLKAWLKNELKQNVKVEQERFHYVHKFSHRTWDISFYQCHWQSGEEIPERSYWLCPPETAGLSWAGPHRKAARALGLEDIVHSNYNTYEKKEPINV
jgi:A/G-specific adenine glycosylase